MSSNISDHFYKEILSNGTTLLCDKREIPVATIIFATRFGSAYESAKYKGMAHFIEHMLFKGTKTRKAKEISYAIERVGGDINAFTIDQMTAFYAKMPKKHFALGAEIVSDMIYNSIFNPKEIEKERQVILEELKRTHDSPNIYVMKKLQESLYGPPFGLSRIGDFGSLSRINRKNMLDYNKYYSPENLIIAVIGNIPHSEIKKEIVKKLPKAKKSPLPVVAPMKRNRDYTEYRENIQQAHLALGFHMPTLSDRKKYVAEIFDCILGKGMSSRLWQEIREKRGLAYTAHSYLMHEKDYGFEAVYIGTKKEKIKEVKEITLNQIRSLQKVEKKEVEDAKENLIGSHEVASERSEDIATNLILNEISTKAEEYYKYSERISDVKLDEVRDLAKIKKYSTVILAPKR